MSAYFVNKAHIDALVTYALDNSIHPRPEASALGRLLWAENAASVRHLHDDADECWTDIKTIAQYRFAAGYVSPISVVKACDCLAYQSCEHPGWGHSAAKRVVDAIRLSALARMGVSHETLRALGPHGPRNPHAAAYADAPGWELDESHLVRDAVLA